MRHCLRLLACVLLVASLSVSHLAAEPIPGIGPVGEVKKLHGDFEFTEGPADDGQGNIYFSDIPANKIYKVDAEGMLSTFLEPSNHTNGLMFASGRLYACEMDGRIVSIDPQSKKVTPITSEHEGQRYNAPNDLVVDREGGVYFTDPHFRAPMPLPQGVHAVYYTSADGKATRIFARDIAPNGVILSPDEKKLYIVPTLSKQMLVAEVKAPGQIGEVSVFCELKQAQEGENRGGDGLTVDSKGNLYITSGLGLQVFNPEGKHLGTIAVPEQPANVTFGGKDLKTLYITARKGLYTAEMEVAGHAFPGPSEK